MPEDNIIVEGGTTQVPSEVEVSNQEAINRYRKSITPDTGDNIPEGFNPDGTPITDDTDDGDDNPDDNPDDKPEENLNDWEAKYKELEIEHILATNENAYRTELGVFDATPIVESLKETGKLSDEDYADLIETGLTKEQIDEAVADILGETKPNTKDTTTDNSKGNVFNVQKFHAELATKGNLSEESYKELEGYGFSRNDVDTYIQGQREIANAFATSLYDMVGGEQEFITLIDWASENMDKETIKSYVEAVENNDRAKVKSLVEFVKFKRDGATPKETPARRLNGNADSYGGIQPFANKSEWFKATSNRLYGRDASYTKMVDKRYLASREKGLI